MAARLDRRRPAGAERAWITARLRASSKGSFRIGWAAALTTAAVTRRPPMTAIPDEPPGRWSSRDDGVDEAPAVGRLGVDRVGGKGQVGGPPAAEAAG